VVLRGGRWLVWKLVAPRNGRHASLVRRRQQRSRQCSVSPARPTSADHSARSAGEDGDLLAV